MIEIELTFRGRAADDGLIEFYDASRALAGFQRSLALTTHLVLNGEIITQAPYAEGFEIYIPPFIEGSWKARAKIVIVGAFLVGSVGKDSPIGHIVTSVYDMALSNTMGFSVDYDKTLQELYHQHHADHPINSSKIDSLCEKIENSVADMHRPIVISGSASEAQITGCGPYNREIGPLMTVLTYDYVKQTRRDDTQMNVSGYVTSYNINTYKGRIFCLEENRPIPFELDHDARDKDTIGVITASQHYHGQDPFGEQALVSLTCEQMVSASGRVKRYIVLDAKEGR